MSDYTIKGASGDWDKLGIQQGAEVRVGSNDQGQAIVEPVAAWPTDPEERRTRFEEGLKKWSGVFYDGRSTDEKMRELRGDPEL